MTEVQPDAAKDLLRRFVETLGSANPAAIRGLFADDARIHTTGSSVVSGDRSVAELFGLLAKLSATVPAGIRMEIRRLIGEGNEAACEALGLSTTFDGRPYNNHYVFWIRAREGKIASLTEFMDTHLVNEVFKPALSGTR